MTKKIQVNLRLYEEVLEELRVEAAKQKRSVNNLLEVVVDEYLKQVRMNNSLAPSDEGAVEQSETEGET